MFDFKSELSKYNGSILFKLEELYALMVMIRLDNIANVAPETTTKVMLEMALINGWIVENLDSSFVVRVG